MASSTADSEDERDREIRLVKSADWWVAKDIDTGVTTQGETRIEALENLDEAVALHRGESGDVIDTPAKERHVLEALDIDPEEVENARDKTGELPDFMQSDDDIP